MKFKMLKKDFKRKRTMNIILLIFITLAAMFMSASAKNIIVMRSALENYFEIEEVPDYWMVTAFKSESDKFKEYAEKENVNYKIQELLSADSENIKINGSTLNYRNNIVISKLKGNNVVYDSENKKIEEVKNGEIYLTNEFINATGSIVKPGDEINIDIKGKKRTFKLKGISKDAMYGSSMLGMTRFIISDNDYDFFMEDREYPDYYSIFSYSDNKDFMNDIPKLELNTVFNLNGDSINSMYIMDMVVAGIILIVSICLVIISVIILRFTIKFTINEEFREIGVMKAIGISNFKIRSLYIIKYIVIAAAGSVMGFFAGLPFGKLLLSGIEQNIIVDSRGSIFINILASLSAGAIVIFLCWLNTGSIKKLSPLDAVRNGNNGDSFKKKSPLSLEKLKISPIPFMAVNDIFCELKRFGIIIFIFIIGILLIDIPINAINSLQSDQMMEFFNLAKCDHVIGEELKIENNGFDRDKINEKLNSVKSELKSCGIDADVFQEMNLRVSISNKDKVTSSIAFQGMGDVKTTDYIYLIGTAPENSDEIAVTVKVAEALEADIGDTVSIRNKMDGSRKDYMITAIYQSMNNLGEGVRFYQDDDIDFAFAFGSFGIQIKYLDNPSTAQKEERKEILKDIYKDSEILTADEYISNMIGGAASQLDYVKYMILAVIICINVLVTVLMVKSYIAKEKNQIAVMKAVGFKNSKVCLWQTLRIGIILLISIILGSILSKPLTDLTAGQIFKIMGLYEFNCVINPLDNYFVYPVILLLFTATAAFLAALQTNKITAKDAAGIE